jgi:hypothetical protein
VHSNFIQYKDPDGVFNKTNSEQVNNMVVTGAEIEIAKTLCTVLLNCVSSYKAVKSAIHEFQKAPTEYQELVEEIQIGIVRIQNIAVILFQNDIVSGLKGANAECVIKVLSRLNIVLLQYGDWVIKIAPRESDTQITALKVSSIPESPSNQELFDLITEAIDSQDSELVILRQQFGVWRRFKWVIHDHSKLKTYKDDIRKWVTHLLDALPPIVLLTVGLDMKKLETLSKENFEYLPGLAHAARRKVIALTPRAATIEKIDRIQLTEDNQEEPELASGSRRKIMIYRKERVLVENKSFTEGFVNEYASMKDITELASLLAVGGVTGFNVLKCLGVLYRHGFAQLLFEIPSVKGVPARLISLTTLISSSHLAPTVPYTTTSLAPSQIGSTDSISNDDGLPGLDEKFELAQALARTVMRLHSEEWLHKSLRGDNIMFLDMRDGKINYSNPYLVGFEYSRGISAVISSTLTNEDGPWTNDIYRHPDRQGQPTQYFEKSHDYYAFGAVLMEIGFWTPLPCLGRFADYGRWEAKRSGEESQNETGNSEPERFPEWFPDPEETKDELIRLAETAQFRHQVGKKWKDVTLKCLTSDFGVEKDDPQQTKLQEAFRELVVEKLLLCSA